MVQQRSSPAHEQPRVRRDRSATVVVIGSGQAGLSAGHHLARRGFTSALDDPAGARTFVMLDANAAPGGAWQHRWESLHMATVNGIFDLPGFPKPPIDDDEPSRTAVPRYFAAFEQRRQLPILRPVTVTAVRRADERPEGELIVDTDAGTWRTRAIVNATGTWTNPLLPRHPGQETFAGRQLHTHDYVSPDEFTGMRVAIVGGGISAIQLLEEISRTATTFCTPAANRSSARAVSIPRSRGERSSPRSPPPPRRASRPAASSPTRGWPGRPTPWRRGTAGSSCAARCSPASNRQASVRRTGRSHRWTSSSGPPASGPRWRIWTR